MHKRFTQEQLIVSCAKKISMLRFWIEKPYTKIAMISLGYTFLIQFFITPPSGLRLHEFGLKPSEWGLQPSHSVFFINNIMDERGVLINVDRKFPSSIFHLGNKIDCSNIAARLLFMGWRSIVYFPVAVAICVPFATILAAKFAFGLIAFSLFCASTSQSERTAVHEKNQESRITIRVEPKNSKVIGRFCMEYRDMVLVLFLGPFWFGLFLPAKTLLSKASARLRGENALQW